jgi:hypothetical protein
MRCDGGVGEPTGGIASRILSPDAPVSHARDSAQITAYLDWHFDQRPEPELIEPTQTN